MDDIVELKKILKKYLGNRYNEFENTINEYIKWHINMIDKDIFLEFLLNAKSDKFIQNRKPYMPDIDVDIRKEL